MATDNAKLAVLVGSRICHDLISPVGAINNGLELLGMAGAMDGPELELISDSVGNANARIRFLRIAFGAAGLQDLGRAETESVLSDLSKGSRVKYHWNIEGSAPRADVRLAFLAGLCMESGLPYGGTVDISRSEDRWTVTGEGRKVTADSALWAALSEPSDDVDITPALIQFALLPELASETGRSVSGTPGEEKLVIQF